MKSHLSHRDVAVMVLDQERSAQKQFRGLLDKSHTLEERAMLRDILLQKEMNELLLRNMFNL